MPVVEHEHVIGLINVPAARAAEQTSAGELDCSAIISRSPTTPISVTCISQNTIVGHCDIVQTDCMCMTHMQTRCVILLWLSRVPTHLRATRATVATRLHLALRKQHLQGRRRKKVTPPIHFTKTDGICRKMGTSSDRSLPARRGRGSAHPALTPPRWRHPAPAMPCGAGSGPRARESLQCPRGWNHPYNNALDSPLDDAVFEFTLPRHRTKLQQATRPHSQARGSFWAHDPMQLADGGQHCMGL